VVNISWQSGRKEAKSQTKENYMTSALKMEAAGFSCTISNPQKTDPQGTV
jgi:hypothetical protein